MPARKRTGVSHWIAEAAIPMLVLDRRRRVRVFNRGAQALLGREAGEVLGQAAQFTSDPDVVTAGSVAEQLAALAPEPSQFAGPATTARITLPAKGTTRTLRAVFVPLEQSTADPTNASDTAPLDRPTPSPKPGRDDHLLVLLLDEAAPGLATLASPSSSHLALASARASQFAAGRTHRIIGQSAAMQRPLRQLSLARRSEASVHVSGPLGSGRRTLARQIHDDSLQAQRPLRLIEIARPLRPSQLREIRHAVLGDDPDNPPPGTLALAAVDRLPRDAQSDFEAWWDTADEESRPRLITTSDRSLATLSSDAEQPLRDGFAALLGTIEIDLPPLTARGGDLPLLAQSIVEDALRQLEREQPAAISPAAMQELREHVWPGNVGELARCLRAAVETCAGPAIEPTDLPWTFRTGQSAAGDEQPLAALQDILDAAERTHIEAALRRSGGSKAGAAKLLGMTRPKLYRRLEALAIDTDDAGRG